MISRCFSENGAELLDLLMTSSCCDILVPGRAAHIGSPNPLLSYQAVEDVFRLAGTKLQLDILSWHGHDSSWVRDGPNLVGATAECNAAPAPGHSHRVTGSRHRRRRQRGRRGCVSQQNGRGVAAMSWRPDHTSCLGISVSAVSCFRLLPRPSSLVDDPRWRHQVWPPCVRFCLTRPYEIRGRVPRTARLAEHVGRAQLHRNPCGRLP
jgi:hypothetical protein